MSLHNLAQHLQTAGRGEDKMLVHMTPKEVSGLQALAMAHGGALTINPETGLPEAGFLSAILPTLAGAALTIGSGGVINPMTAGLIIGGAGTAMTGDLGKGLMMGLGAYGGAGFGAGLSAAGTGASFVDDVAMAGGAQSASAAQAAGQTMPNKLIAEQALQEAGKTPFSTAFKGLQSLGTEAGRGAFMSGTSAVAPYATPASLGSTAMNQYYDKLEEMAKLGGSAKSKSLIRPYELERAYSSEPDAYGRYFRDKYTALEPYRAPGPEYRAAGGLLAFSDGGMPVEQMSRQNAIGANTRYPMASQTTSTYATPAERPISENIINPPGYEAFDPYTGAQRFDVGGAISSAASILAKPKITEWDKTKKIADLNMIQDIYERMGGVGQISDDLAKRYLKNKRSEEQIAKDMRSQPYFSSKSYTIPGITGGPQGFSEEDWGKINQFKTERINSVAQATLGRDATPEEFAKLSGAQISLAGMGDWFKKNAKDEYGAYQQKAYDTRQTTAAKKEEAAKQEAFAADPKNWAKSVDTANMFRQTFGRPPTPAELQQYQSMNLTPEKLKEKMRADPMYEQMLTGQLSRVGTPKFTTDAAGQQQLEGALSPYQSATQRLGLGQFYGDMDAALRNQMATAGQGMQFAAPQAQANLSALDQYYAPRGTNITQGSAEQAQLSSLMSAQDVARQASMYGIGPNIARAGAANAFAPRFTSSGNIYSAGFYSPQYGGGMQPSFGTQRPQPMGSGINFSTMYASGGIADLGGYSDGGRLLKGPGDGVSDSIPASIGGRRPARLADGEFVIPARIVSELGNGSTEAGARQLYAMMERVQKRRGKTTGKNKVAVDSGAKKLLPA